MELLRGPTEETVVVHHFSEPFSQPLEFQLPQKRTQMDRNTCKPTGTKTKGYKISFRKATTIVQREVPVSPSRNPVSRVNLFTLSNTYIKSL